MPKFRKQEDEKIKTQKKIKKKAYLGEFQEFGFEISTKLKINVGELEFDKFCNDFIDMIEENNLAFGGGGGINVWEGFVCSWNKFASPSNKDKEKIKMWLENRKEIVNCEVGEFIDAWNNPKWNN